MCGSSLPRGAMHAPQSPEIIEINANYRPV